MPAGITFDRWRRHFHVMAVPRLDRGRAMTFVVRVIGFACWYEIAPLKRAVAIIFGPGPESENIHVTFRTGLVQQKSAAISER